MKLLDKLLFKAGQQGERLDIAFMTFNGETGLYKVDCRLWDGVWGSGGRRIILEYQTEQEAFDAVDRIEAQYPNKKAVLIYDNLDRCGD